MGIFLLIVIGGGIIIPLIPLLISMGEDSKVKKAQNEQYENACRNWNLRATELGFSSVGKSKVYMKYNNCDEFYPIYVWVENGNLRSFIAEPSMSTAAESFYTYPENLKVTYFGNIRRIYRTGSQGQYTERDFSHAQGMNTMANLSANSIERAYYSKKALDATIYAPSRTVKYDNRRTIMEADNGPFNFHIDAYDVFKRLIPDKC